MNSKLKTAAAIAAVIAIATAQVYAEEWLGRLKVQAEAQVVSVSAVHTEKDGYKKEPLKIVIVPAVNNFKTVIETARLVSETAETVIETAQPVSETAETVIETVESPVYYDIPLDREQQDIVREISGEYGVPFELALAVMQVESGFDVDVIGSGNCYGIMQIHKINHPALEKQLSITDWLSLSDNARAGCYMLGKLLDKYQDETRALMAYNMGEGAAKKAWNAGTRSTGYTEKVKAAKQSLTGQVNEKAAG